MEVGKYIRFEIDEKERGREKPRKSTKKIKTSIHLSTDHVYVITPSQSIIEDNTKVTVHLHLLDSHTIYMNVQIGLQLSSPGVNQHRFRFASIQMEPIAGHPVRVTVFYSSCSG